MKSVIFQITSQCLETDTIRISYIGYQTQDLTIKTQRLFGNTFKRSQFNAKQHYPFWERLDPESIVKKVLENKTTITVRPILKQIFLRNRYTNHMNELNFRC